MQGLSYSEEKMLPTECRYCSDKGNESVNKMHGKMYRRNAQNQMPNPYIEAATISNRDQYLDIRGY